MLSTIHDGLFLINRRRAYVFFNTGCERITGYSSDEILGSQCTYGDIVVWRDKHGRALTGVLCPTRALFEGTCNAKKQRMEFVRRDGRKSWVDTYYTALKDAQGNVEFVLGVVRELSAEDLKHSVPEADDMSLGVTDADSQNPNSPENTAQSMLLDKHLEDVERRAILKALAAAGWQRNKAADLMGISRSRLYRRMEALGIDPNAK